MLRLSGFCRSSLEAGHCANSCWIMNIMVMKEDMVRLGGAGGMDGR